MRHVIAAFLFVCALSVSSQAAFAACWRLPSGQVVETNSNSIPPVRGAVVVLCPPSLPNPFQRQTSPQVRPEVQLLSRTRGANDDNCVLFARSRVRSLPSGLETWLDKQRIVNSRSPTVGSVAVIAVPGGPLAPFGHLAVVQGVTSNSITIIEANYAGPSIQRRRSVGVDINDAARRLNIVGYYRP